MSFLILIAKVPKTLKNLKKAYFSYQFLKEKFYILFCYLDNRENLAFSCFHFLGKWQNKPPYWDRNFAASYLLPFHIKTLEIQARLAYFVQNKVTESFFIRSCLTSIKKILKSGKRCGVVGKRDPRPMSQNRVTVTKREHFLKFSRFSRS